MDIRESLRLYITTLNDEGVELTHEATCSFLHGYGAALLDMRHDALINVNQVSVIQEELAECIAEADRAENPGKEH